MPRPIRRVEIYLPLDYNDGRPIPDSKFTTVEDQLLDRFGGVTATQRRFPLRGVWQSAGEVFQDRIVVFTVMDFSNQGELEVLRYLGRLKTSLKRRFEQIEVLITLESLLAV